MLPSFGSIGTFSEPVDQPLGKQEKPGKAVQDKLVEAEGNVLLLLGRVGWLEERIAQRSTAIGLNQPKFGNGLIVSGHP